MISAKDLKEFLADTGLSILKEAVTDLSKPSKEVLEIAVTEQRRFHDELTSSYRSLRLKIITFIGAVLTLLAFLYASPDSGPEAKGLSALERLFIPDSLYGKIFYAIGLGCLLYALARLVHGAKPNALWHVPFSSDDYKNLNEKDPEKFLQTLKNEYAKSIETNLVEHSKRSEAITESFYPLLVGAIILIVLRYFQ
jgi:hypothetical protein